jgi:hypothetical protein
VLFVLVLSMSYFALLSMLTKSNWMMEKYVVLQLVLTAAIMGFGLYVWIRYFIFDWVSIFGYHSYFSEHWADLLKKIDMNEFKSGYLSCIAGKYN